MKRLGAEFVSLRIFGAQQLLVGPRFRNILNSWSRGAWQTLAVSLTGKGRKCPGDRGLPVSFNHLLFDSTFVSESCLAACKSELQAVLA